MVAQKSNRDQLWCRVAHISCQRTEQSALPRLLVHAPLYVEHANAKGSKLFEHSGRHVCQRKFNLWKQDDGVLILTNIAIPAAGAAVLDHCSCRLASGTYRNSLSKISKDRYIPTRRTTHLSAILFTKFRGNSDDQVGIGVGFATTTETGIIPGSLQAKRSASCVGNYQ